MEYKWKETWLSRVNPSLKLVTTIIGFIAIIFVHNPNALLVLFLASLFLLFCFSGHPRKFVLLYCLPFLLLFISSSSAMVLFGKGETTWFHYGLIHITEESFYRGIHLGLRASTFAVLGLLFALTTKPVLLFYSLMQQLKLPANIAYSFMASIRMLPIMVSEFQTLHYAYRIRGLDLGKGATGFLKKMRFLVFHYWRRPYGVRNGSRLLWRLNSLTGQQNERIFIKSATQNGMSFSLLHALRS